MDATGDDTDPQQAIQFLESALSAGDPSSLLLLSLAHAYLLDGDCPYAQDLLDTAYTAPATAGIGPDALNHLEDYLHQSIADTCQATLAISCNHDETELHLDAADAPAVACGDTLERSPGPLTLHAHLEGVRFRYQLDLEPGPTTELHVGLRPRTPDDISLFFQGEVVSLTPDQQQHHERAREALEATPPQPVRALNHLRAALDDLQPSLALYLLAIEGHLENEDCPAALDALDDAHRAPATRDVNIAQQLQSLDDLDDHLAHHCIASLTFQCDDPDLQLQSDVLDAPRCDDTFELAPQSLFVTASHGEASERHRIQLRPGQSKSLTLRTPTAAPTTEPSRPTTISSSGSSSSSAFALIPSIGFRALSVDSLPDSSSFTTTEELDSIQRSLAFWIIPRSRFALEVLYARNSGRDHADFFIRNHHQLQLHALLRLVDSTHYNAWLGAGLSAQSTPQRALFRDFSSLGFSVLKLHQSIFSSRSVSPYGAIQVDIFTSDDDRSAVGALLQTGLMFNFGH